MFDIELELIDLSLVVSKPFFCICEHKDADQLRHTDSAIPLLSDSEISSL